MKISSNTYDSTYEVRAYGGLLVEIYSKGLVQHIMREQGCDSDAAVHYLLAQ